MARAFQAAATAALFSLSAMGCAVGGGPDELGVSETRLNAADWNVREHGERAAAFERVFAMVQEQPSETYPIALLSPHAAPRALDEAELEQALAEGHLDRVPLDELAVVESGEEAFVVLVRGHEGFRARAVVVPARAVSSIHTDGELLTIGERHADGSQSSSIGVAQRRASYESWLVGDRS